MSNHQQEIPHMSTLTASATQAPAVYTVLADINQQWFVAALGAAVLFNFASIIGDGALTTQELAQQTQTQETWVYRTLRALSTRGYFLPVEGKSRMFRNTPHSDVLRDDHPQSMRALALTVLGRRSAQQWSFFPETMRTGQPAAEMVLGMSTYEYFDQHEEERLLFDQAMQNFASTVNTAIVEAFDFARYSTILDIGGGDGSLLELIIRCYPAVSGALFERPILVKQLRQTPCPFAVIAGDFFEELPAAELYIIKEVLHNWSDEQCIQILQACRRANPQAAVLVSEQVIGEGRNFAEWLDLLMGVEQNGCERTLQEYKALFAGAGYHLSQTVPTHSSHTLLLAEV
ncbi:MAG: hypothetical protein E6J34_13400 [Chloroflexi bacterium]|nr:MAG: hypothetical protein E6J34_13400 [Chloroflexota bacterium]